MQVKQTAWFKYLLTIKDFNYLRQLIAIELVNYSEHGFDLLAAYGYEPNDFNVDDLNELTAKIYNINYGNKTDN